MHASIAVFLMMVGGPVFPEAEITTIPLKDDLLSPNIVQEQEWQERVKTKPLPRVPTLDDRQQAGGYYNGPRPYSPTDPRAMHPNQGLMPVSPTEAGGQPMGNMPYQPGGATPTGGGYAPGGGYQAGGAYPPGGAKNDPYANNGGRNPVSGYNATSNIAAPVANSVGRYDSNFNTSVAQMTARYGLPNSTNTTSDPMAANKPFSGYTPPNGYSPWQSLYTTTNNGTLDPYTQRVQPQLNQMNFNAHLSEQINGVQTMQRGMYGGTPGMETNVGGAGVANPNIMQNYIPGP